MAKGIIVGIQMLFLIILEVFQGDGVTVDIQAPAEVIAGEEFVVNVTISKGGLSTFSRLQQDLPAGLEAVADQSANSNFSFDDKKVRHIWLKMPEDNVLTLAYKVTADERLIGDFDIKGKFSFIDNNERRTINVIGPNIVINPSPNIDPSEAISLADYERLISPYEMGAETEPQIACIRQEPKYDKTKDEYIVELLVSKERKERFAKIEESIPHGYRAEAIDDHDAIFTYKNNKAKFLWMNLPSSSLFTVSYKLVPDVKLKKSPEIKGEFSYLEEERTQSIDIIQTGEPIASVGTREELLALIDRTREEQLNKRNQELLAENTLPSKTYKTPIGKAEESSTITTETKEPVEPVETATPKVQNAISKKISNLSNRKYQLETEEGVYYRVQVAAGHKPVNVKRYFNRYKLNKQVKIESHEGWYKYSIGSFPVYEEARDYRVFVWNTTEIDDAFVAAYNSGTRITVQEALMIANHKWYK